MNKETTTKKSKYPKAEFNRIDANLILSEGIILKQLNKRYRKKKTILEYYKCKNGSSRALNAKNGKCKFSGKLTYQIGSNPQFLEIIHPHSALCIQGTEQSYSASKKTTSKARKKKIKAAPKTFTFSRVNPLIYQDSVPIIAIQIQLKKDRNSESEDIPMKDEHNESFIIEIEDKEHNHNGIDRSKVNENNHGNEADKANDNKNENRTENDNDTKINENHIDNLGINNEDKGINS